MIIRNLTDSIQKISVREILGDHRQYEIYVQPKGSTELIGLEVVDKCKLGKIFTTEVTTVPAPTPTTTIAPTEEVTKVEVTEVSEDPKDVKVEEAESVEETPKASAHVCDICGSEFASARALNSHKNKAHAGE